jgi:Fur family ferric uptake transcriptional regulator|tara:strand:- start:25 stop:438 length:414 start_codon:yes stop_codon:yes gene_type:complete
MAEDKNLREAGLKVTLPRIRILEIFEESDTKHLSADEVYKKLVEAGDEVGLATVYRVLTQFESAGILLKQNFENGHSVYELTPNDHHDHMVCLKTGKVIEFTNEIIEEQQEKLASERGYKIVDHRLVLYVEPLNNEE